MNNSIQPQQTNKKSGGGASKQNSMGKLPQRREYYRENGKINGGNEEYKWKNCIEIIDYNL